MKRIATLTAIIASVGLSAGAATTANAASPSHDAAATITPAPTAGDATSRNYETQADTGAPAAGQKMKVKGVVTRRSVDS